MNVLRLRGWYLRPNSQVEIKSVSESRNDWNCCRKGAYGAKRAFEKSYE